MNYFSGTIIGRWRYEKTGREYEFKESGEAVIYPEGRVVVYSIDGRDMDFIKLILDERRYVITNIVGGVMYLITDRGDFIELVRI